MTTNEKNPSPFKRRRYEEWLSIIKDLSLEKKVGVIEIQPLYFRKEKCCDEEFCYIPRNEHWVEKSEQIEINVASSYKKNCDTIEELAISMAAGVEFLREMLTKGLVIDDVASRIKFSFSVSSNIFIELSKLRAARFLWAYIVQLFGGSEISQQVGICAYPSHCQRDGEKSHLDIAKITIEAFSGIVGGCDDLEMPTSEEVSGRVMRHIPLILREESCLDKRVDPARGSWFVETLTEQLEKKAWKRFQEIEERGGIKAL